MNLKTILTAKILLLLTSSISAQSIGEASATESLTRESAGVYLRGEVDSDAVKTDRAAKTTTTTTSTGTVEAKKAAAAKDIETLKQILKRDRWERDQTMASVQLMGAPSGRREKKEFDSGEYFSEKSQDPLV